MKVGDLVQWQQGYCDTPGLVLEVKPAKGASTVTLEINPTGMVVLAMLPELDNYPEWFHEYELKMINTPEEKDYD
jgi:3-methyladenine DNA glycosylase Tag